MKKEYSSEFKAKAVLEVLRETKSLKEIAGEKFVHPNMLGRWKKEAESKLHTIFEEGKKKENEKRAHEEQVQELYAQIGELTAKLSWLKKKGGIDIQ
jgi:transposase-like protein